MLDTQIQWCLWKENLSSNDELFMGCFIITDDGYPTLNKNVFKEQVYFSIEIRPDAIWLKPNPIKKHRPLGNVFYPVKQFSPPNRRALLLEINKLGPPIPVTGPSCFNIYSKLDLIHFSFDQIIELQFSNEKTVTAELLEKSFTISSLT